MSASNYNWVCFDCRTAMRKTKTAGTTPKCPGCGADCYCLGYKVEIPKEQDAPTWRKLRLDCRRRELASSDQYALERVRVVHEIERRIAHLESLASNQSRKESIAALKKKLGDWR